jgi:allophanate hydrolase subunit 2
MEENKWKVSMKFNLMGTRLKSRSLENKKTGHNIHNNKVNDLRYLKYLSKE